MTNEKYLTMDQMRGARNTYEAVFMEFVNGRRYFDTHAFCFYEGEDGKYYDLRIRKKFGDNFIAYKVGNKDGVLKLLEKISQCSMYADVCTMFFIDRDYDESKAGLDERLYETPCYSIENLYIGKNCLLKILQSEFGLNEIDEDCKKCLCDFEKREQEFNAEILEFNALIYLLKRKQKSNSIFRYGNIKTTQLLIMDVSGIHKSKKYDNIINEMKSILNCEECEIEDAKRQLLERGDSTLVFRGKNQLDFFICFVMRLKALNREGNYFSKKYNGVKLCLTENRLSELSQYAATPESLEEFLYKHKCKRDTRLAIGA